MNNWNDIVTIIIKRYESFSRFQGNEDDEGYAFIYIVPIEI
jgi:hypothetical protein